MRWVANALAFSCQARSSSLPVLTSGLRQIEQKKRPAFAGESLHHQLQAPACLFANIHDAPYKASLLVPGLQNDPGTAIFQGEVAARQRNHFFPRFQERGLFGGFEETLNCCLKFLGAAAGNPPGGGLAHSLYSSAVACARAIRLLF